MTIVAHTHPFVIGVDTHAKTHALSILATPSGEIVEEATFPTTRSGLARAVAWAGRRTGGDLGALWVIECAATYGAQLARAVTDTGYTVVEAARMNAKANRGIGKSDQLDARRIAAAVMPLEVDRMRQLRSDDAVRAGLRVLVTARELMTGERTANVNALLAMLRMVDLASTRASRSRARRSARCPIGAPATKSSASQPPGTKPCGSPDASPL